MSQGADVSYNVYILSGYDAAGEEIWEEVHFHEERNALAYKARLENAGETVHMEKAPIYGFSETAKEAWFEDYPLD